MTLRPRARNSVAALLFALVPTVAVIAPLAFAQSGAVPNGPGTAKVVPAPSSSTTSAGPVVVAPKIKTYVEPVYPPERLAKGEKADVVVELVLDATGKVTNAKIVLSGGDDFDAAALAAARQLLFEPATSDGKPIPAKIAKYRFRFDFKEVPKEPTPGPTTKPEVPSAPSISISGKLKTPTEEPIAGAVVVAAASNGTKVQAVTDASGTFLFADLPDGKYELHVEVPGFAPFVADETVKKGIVTEVVYRPSLADGGIDIVVKGEKPPREVVKRVLEQREISRIPGTNGDALRAIQNLPGVARPPGFAGLLIIRGSAPTDTNVFIDGTLVPLVYHFGGLSSVVPTEVVEKFDFYPGNFGTEYGRVMGGIVDVALRSPTKEGAHGLIQFDIIDGRILAEGAIDSKTRFLVAGRRSWVDVWLKPVLEKTGTGVSTAPVYYDYQLMLERDLDAKTTARLAFFGSDDRLAITLNTPSSADPAAGGDISAHTGFFRLQGRTDTLLTKDTHWINTVAYGRDVIDFTIGDYFFRLNSHPITYRSDLRTKLSKEIAVIGGVDFLWNPFDVTLHFPPPPQPGEAAGPFFARPAPTLSTSSSLFRPAIYGLLELSPTKVLKFLPGVRLDYAKDSQQWNLSPRVAMFLDIVPEFPKTTLKAAAGVFFQPPQPQESISPFGTPGLKNNRAIHYDVGAVQQLTKQVDITVDGFYKDLSDLVVRKSSASTTASGITYTNDGIGRVLGLEVLLKYKPDDRFFGWLAYTLSHSQRRDTAGAPWRNAQYDQTHIFTILGSYRLGRGWELGARWRYVSGSMFTPNHGGVSDFDAGSYAPIPSYPAFGERLPAFHQGDIRVDKVWKFSSWKLSAYLDVQNVYNHANPEGVRYNYNYSQRDIITGLPIIPNLGIRGEL